MSTPGNAINRIIKMIKTDIFIKQVSLKLFTESLLCIHFFPAISYFVLYKKVISPSKKSFKIIKNPY